MQFKFSYWLKSLCIASLSSLSITSCASAATDFDQVGKQMSILLQNFHFSKQEFSDEMSQKFLDMYLNRMDPNKIFFTQEDIDALKKKYGEELDDYLMSSETMTAAKPLYNLYKQRALQRVEMARKLLIDHNFKFDRDKTVPRSRKKAEWAKDEAAMLELWKDMVEEQLLSEILRRETVSKLAEEQGKPDPLANEKPAEEKLLMRYERILRNIQECDEEDFANALLSAVALTYDPHTEYMSAREVDRFKQSMNPTLTGIGALLSAEDDGSTKISGIVVGGPAEKGGELKLNDKIVAVDSRNTGDMEDILFMKIDKVVDKIRGPEGSTVRLKVEGADTPGQAKIITIVRQKVDLKDELAKAEIVEVLNQGKPEKIGIVRLPSFYADMDGGARRCAKDVRKLVERMIKEKVNGIIIDLRNNGGGSLAEVCDMTGFFTGKGPVVQVKDTRGRIETKSSDSQTLFNGPIVVMINKLSASASEILAAALQDYGRAVVVGDTASFGKGTVQQPIDIARFLPAFSSKDRAGYIKITTQKFYRIAGGSTQLKGVESDIVLPTVTAAFDIGEKTMDFAMPYDKIPPSKGYEQSNRVEKILPELQKRSAERVAKNPDFQVAKEDIDLIKKRIDENTLSLNKSERQKENTDLLDRKKKVNEERKTRFAEMTKDDAKNLKIYRLTLEDVDAPELSLVDPNEENKQFMKMAEDPTDQLDSTPDYPSGLDPELREAINIVNDMINLENK